MLRIFSRNLIRYGNLRNRITLTRQFSSVHVKSLKNHTQAVLLASTVSGGYLLIQEYKDKVLCEPNVQHKEQKPKYHEIIREDLPFITDEELALHDNKYHITKSPGVDTFDIIGNSWEIEREKGVWVSYGVGVYDITNLIDKHGTPEVTIMLAAGMALDPFWEDEEMAKLHSKPYIAGMMEKCRIGNLKKTDEDEEH